MQSHCFENVIGLSRSFCPCLGASPEDANVSASGLFLNELDGLNLRLIDNAHGCGQGGIWDMMGQARASAIEDAKTDLLACIRKNTMPRRRSGRSQVGNTIKTQGDVSLKQPFHGATLRLPVIRGGTFTLHRIAAGMRWNGPFTVSLYDREALITTFDLTATDGQVIWHDVPPTELPMKAVGGQYPQYWLVYTPPSTTSKAMNLRITCKCGGWHPEWHEKRPCFMRDVPSDEFVWAEWAMASGVRGTDIALRNDWSCGVNELMGLALDVSFSCDTKGVICPEPPDPEDPFYRVFAHAVRMRAGAYLIQSILVSGRIGALTMTSGQVLEGLKKSYSEGYARRIEEYLCPEYSEGGVNLYSDCLACMDHHGMHKGTIFA